LSYSAIGGFGRFGFWIADLGLGFPNLDSIASRESPNPRSQSSIPNPPILNPPIRNPQSSILNPNRLIARSRYHSTIAQSPILNHSMAQRPTLLLFDIDGTLVLTGRAGARAMSRAFQALWGVSDAFAGISMGGRTDSFLVSQALERAGLPDTIEQHARFRRAYLPRLAEEVEQPGTGVKGVMPGVRELLDAAHAHPHLHLALLTGNYQEAAAIKLRYFDLWHYFAFGAYSDDAADRNLLVPIARERALRHGLPAAAGARVMVIGDTPHDVACAAVAGAKSLGVATGGHSRDELTRAGADIALDDLSDTEYVLRLLAAPDEGSGALAGGL
jgi:phosphoglycolate phosphatase